MFKGCVCGVGRWAPVTVDDGVFLAVTVIAANVFTMRFVLSVFFNSVSTSTSVSASVDDIISFGKLARFKVKFN